MFDKLTFRLVYHTYSNSVINMILLCSTWLTVTLALGRYLAVCYPIRARELFGVAFAKRSLFGVVCCCILFNLPRFFEFYVAQIKCDDGETMYFTYYGYMKSNFVAYNIYTWIYFIFAILIPFMALVFCNWHLACALHRAQKTRLRLRAPGGNVTEPNTMMTSVLVAVVIMYILLVSPAEIINFLRHQYMQDTELFNLAVAAVNTLQAINFSINFVLYYIINKSFRKSIIGLMMCRWRPRQSGHLRRASFYTSVSNSGHTKC